MSMKQIRKNGEKVTRSDTHNTDSFNEAKMLRCVNAVARNWTNRLKCDPSHDVDDMAQDLAMRYWEYWKEHKMAPGPLTVRRWAWGVMRSWGYHGPNGGHLKHSNMEVSFSRHPATRENDCTDDELLDIANVRNLQGWTGKYDES